MRIQQIGNTRLTPEDHGLDFPGDLYTTDIRVTGKGHDRIVPLMSDYHNECIGLEDMDDEDRDTPEGNMAAWLVNYASSAVFHDSTARSTVLRFENPEDAARFIAAFPREAARRGKAVQS